MDPWFGYGVPVLVIAAGAFGLAYARMLARQFERKYGEWPMRRPALVPVRIDNPRRRQG